VNSYIERLQAAFEIDGETFGINEVPDADVILANLRGTVTISNGYFYCPYVPIKLDAADGFNTIFKDCTFEVEQLNTHNCTATEVQARQDAAR